LHFSGLWFRCHTATRVQKVWVGVNEKTTARPASSTDKFSRATRPFRPACNIAKKWQPALLHNFARDHYQQHWSWFTPPTSLPLLLAPGPGLLKRASKSFRNLAAVLHLMIARWVHRSWIRGT
jgi:hypothetical protein